MGATRAYTRAPPLRLVLSPLPSSFRPFHLACPFRRPPFFTIPSSHLPLPSPSLISASFLHSHLRRPSSPPTSYLASAPRGNTYLHFGATISQVVFRPPRRRCLPGRFHSPPFLFLFVCPFPPTCASRRIYCGETLFVASSGSCASSALLHCSVFPLLARRAGSLFHTCLIVLLSIMPLIQLQWQPFKSTHSNVVNG